MPDFKFSARSKKAMEGIHPDLRKVADLAIQKSAVDFIVTEGKRTLAQQRIYVKKGASRTMKSKHLTGRAIDTVAWYNGSVSYQAGLMKQIAAAFKAASKELGIPIEWGGDWKGAWDMPHFQLPDSYKG